MSKPEATTIRTVEVYCDESGNSGDGHLVVAAVAFDANDVASEEETLREEHDRVVALESRSGVSFAKRFRSRGFHKHEDKFSTQSWIVSVLGRSLRRKVFIATTSPERLKTEDEGEALLRMYQFLAKTIIRKFRDYDIIKFKIEVNPGLEKELTVETLVSREIAGDIQLQVEFLSKGPASPLSEADYYASACAHWLNLGMKPPRKGEKGEVVYLQFVEMLGGISLIWSSEDGPLHTRTSPWNPIQ